MDYDDDDGRDDGENEGVDDRDDGDADKDFDMDTDDDGLSDFDGGIGNDLDDDWEDTADFDITDDWDADIDIDAEDFGEPEDFDEPEDTAEPEDTDEPEDKAIEETSEQKEDELQINDEKIPDEPNSELRDPTLSPDQLEIIEEMDRKGETEVAPTDLGPATRTSSNPVISADVHFKDNSEKASYTSDQLVGQAQHQEEGLSNMTVAQFIDNYNEYQEKGRSPEAAKEQQDYRDGLAETIKADAKAADPGLTEEELDAVAKAEMSNGAALHDPDMRAGGFASGIHGYGNSAANSSLGAQWAHGQADSLYEQVMEQVANNGMTREDMENTYLDVTIHMDKT